MTKTINVLGYPARRQTLYNWTNRKGLLLEEHSTFRGNNTSNYPHHWSLNFPVQKHRHFGIAETASSIDGNHESGDTETAYL